MGKLKFLVFEKDSLWLISPHPLHIAVEKGIKIRLTVYFTRAICLGYHA